MIAPRIAGIAFLLACAPVAAAADASSAVLVVNTDASVEKYAQVQESFESTIDIPTVHVDLAREKLGEAELRRLIDSVDPRVIHCIGSKAYITAVKVAEGRKIVLSSALNWERLPVGPSTYGIANELGAGMQLTTFRYIFPDVSRIGVLYNVEYNRESLRNAVEAGRDVGIEIVERTVRRPEDLGASLASLLGETIDAIWLIPDPTVMPDVSAVKEIFARSHEHGKPVFAYQAVFALEGAVLAVSPDDPTIGRQAAQLVEDLADGRVIADRFQAPAGSQITLNLGRVQAYGLNLNEDALESVNRIIQ